MHTAGKRKSTDVPQQQFICGKCGQVCGHLGALREHQKACQQARYSTGPPEERQEFPSGEHCQPFDSRRFMEKALNGLGKCRVKGHVPRDTMQLMKLQFKEILEETKAQVRAHLHNGDTAGAEQAMEQVVDAWGNISKRDAELKHLEAHDAYQRPQRRYLGEGRDGESHYAYDGDVKQQLEGMWKHCPKVWADVKSSPERWSKKGFRTTPDFDPGWTIEDTSDGYEFGRFITCLAEKGGIPLVFILYYDGLEVVNGLGQARGTHKLGCFYWALVNINQADRFKHIHLATVALEKDVSHFRPEVIIGGREDEDFSTSMCWAAHMSRLEGGENIPTPDGVLRFVGATAILAADTPAAALIVGTKESVGPSTKSICRLCHASQHGENDGDPPPFKAAHSFLSGLPGWAEQCGGRSCRFRMRSSRDLEQYLNILQRCQRGEITRGEVATWLQSHGINNIHGAMRKVPLWDIHVGAPMDIMHIILEGITRNLLAMVWYFMVREWGVDQEDLLEAINDHARHEGERRHRYPWINPSRLAKLREGQAGGLPLSDCAFPGTAAQVMYMALASTSMFLPRLPAHATQTPVWQCWLQHVNIVKLTLQRSFTMADLVALDMHIWLQDSLWLLCPKLAHAWKPKNHYLSHVPHNILQWGPPRFYWCMPFEHENQLYKQAAVHSNFSNVLYSCANAKAYHVVLAYMGEVDDCHDQFAGCDAETLTEQALREMRELQERLDMDAVFRF